MGYMTKIESNKVEIKKSSEEIYFQISDFNYFKKIIPSNLDNIKILNDSICEFKIEGMPKISLIISEKNPHDFVSMKNHEGKLNFKLNFYINKIENYSTLKIIFEAELNIMMKMMVEKPLKNFLNNLIEKIKSI